MAHDEEQWDVRFLNAELEAAENRVVVDCGRGTRGEHIAEPRSKSISGGTRESTQERIAANGV
jgi:hypothetical protein